MPPVKDVEAPVGEDELLSVLHQSVTFGAGFRGCQNSGSHQLSVAQLVEVCLKFLLVGRIDFHHPVEDIPGNNFGPIRG